MGKATMTPFGVIQLSMEMDLPKQVWWPRNGQS